MRKREMIQLFDYMYWVNRRLLDAAARLPPGAFTEPCTVTTRDLRATLVHELDVEWSWRLNVQGKPLEEWGADEDLRPDDYPDVATLREHWRRDEGAMRAWLQSLSDEQIAGEVPSAFTGDRRPLWQYLMHIFTHATQQQADVATLLSLAGRSPEDIGFPEYLSAIGKA